MHTPGYSNRSFIGSAIILKGKNQVYAFSFDHIRWIYFEGQFAPSLKLLLNLIHNVRSCVKLRASFPQSSAFQSPKVEIKAWQHSEHNHAILMYVLFNSIHNNIV